MISCILSFLLIISCLPRDVTHCHVTCDRSLIRFSHQNYLLRFRGKEEIKVWVKYVETDSQHSSLTTHFSVSSVWSWHSEPSSGYCLTYRSLDLIPIPQDTLQADQLIHSDIIHVDGSVHQEKEKQQGILSND